MNQEDFKVYIVTFDISRKNSKVAFNLDEGKKHAWHFTKVYCEIEVKC